MKKSVYVETSILSYLTARPSRDILRAARQELTRQWWEKRRQDFEVFVSQLVLDEAAEGDDEAARKRLEALADIPSLDVTDEVASLAESLIAADVLPRTAAGDAIHVGVATVHAMDFLLTWNFRHLANAELIGPIRRFLRERGYEPPLVCTPEELMGEHQW